MNDLSGITSPRGQELALAPDAPAAPAEGGFQPFGEDGFTFFDLLDIINPLQHIPLLSNIYREMTGDTLDPATRVMGGTLFGGPIGLVASLVSVIIEESTGKDPGDHLLALLEDDGTGDVGGEDTDVDEIAQFATAAGGITGDPIVEITLAEINVLRIEAGLPPVPVNAPPIELATETFDYPPPPAVQAFPSPGQASTDGGGSPIPAAGPLPWLTGQAAVPAFNPPSPAVQAFPSPGQASTDGRGPPPAGDGVLPWLADQAAAPAPPAPVTRPPSAPAPGQESQSAAVAPLGGWFSDVMLTALARYEEGAKLSDATAARGLNITN